MEPCGARDAGTAGFGPQPTINESQAGFSLIELIVVLVIIGLLSVVAVPRFFGNSVFEERAYRDEVAAALRYARNLAVASGCPVRVQIDAGSYALSQQALLAGHCDSNDLSWSVQVRLPDGQVFDGTAPPGVVTAPALSIVFDPAGRPDQATNLVISIGSSSVTLHAGSGYLSP